MDASAPIAMGRYMAAAIPNSQAFSYAGEGHLSLISNYLEEILHVLSMRARRQTSTRVTNGPLSTNKTLARLHDGGSDSSCSAEN